MYLWLDNAQQSDTEKMYQQLGANTYVNLQASDMPEIGYTSETASMQDALILMNGDSELTAEEQKTLEIEATERNTGSGKADILFSQQLAVQYAPVDNAATVTRTSQIEDDSILTTEEQTAQKTEEDERNTGSGEADVQFSQQLAAQDASVDSVATSTGTRTSQMDFSDLLKQNTDTVAWLTIGDSIVNYPVVQGQDNQYYLDHRFDREYSRAGTVFVDYRNTPGFQDQNTIIYGHHVGNGTMFCTIKDYKKQAYYDQYPTMTLYTPNGDYLVEFFAGIIVPIRQKALPCFYMQFENDKAFSDYIVDAKRRSTFQSTVDVQPGDRIVTLCTCTYEVYNARYVLQGKLTPMI